MNILFPPGLTLTFDLSHVLNDPGVDRALEAFGTVAEVAVIGVILVRAWTLADLVCLRKLRLHSLILSWQEDDLHIIRKHIMSQVRFHPSVYVPCCWRS